MHDTDATSDDWTTYRRLVMGSIEGLQQDIKDLRGEISQYRAELQKHDADQDRQITALRIRLAGWGGLAGAVGGGGVMGLLKVFEKAAG